MHHHTPDLHHGHCGGKDPQHDGRRGPHGHGPRHGGTGFGPMGGPFGGRRGPGRGQRGDVRNTLLALIAEEPRNGYQLIGAISEKTDGLWRPGPGSVYPALTLLTDEGLVTPEDEGGKKTYRLTPEGEAWMGEHADEVTEPWRKVTEGHEGYLDVRKEVGALAMALQQVVMAGDAAQVKAARAVVDQARKDVYKILAGE